MAVDDVTTVITVNMAQNDTTDRQPGSGVEELLLAVADVDFDGTAPYKGADIRVLLIDGTNNDSQYFSNATAGNSGAHPVAASKAMADNTNYFRIVHLGASTGDYGFAVIQVG